MKKDKEIIRSTKNVRKTRGSSKPDVMMPVPASLLEMPAGYAAFFAGLKERIARERIKAVLSANSAMVLMYWDIGRSILERQHKEGWGAKVIDRLSCDLKKAFPDMAGFSPRNLKYMRTFADAWPDRLIVQRTVAQLPWRSNLTLLDKLSDPETRLWYALKALELGMGKDMLVKDKDQMVVEYSLAGYGKPIGVAQWERQITRSLPDELKSSLPTIEEIEAELGGDLG